ncbi:MAG: class I SAM-dependent methyltransferase [Acidimicrobiales bacterium]|nr:class I SAM-dependent methyltransferase [Acidimicrobiales bacterium]
MASEADYYEQAALWDAQHLADSSSIDERLDRTLALLPADAGCVVDVGAGDGRFVRLLAGRPDGPPVFAVERSRTALGRIGVAGVQASAEALPFGDASVDTLCALEVIEHLPVEIYARALAELARVARRYVVISVPNRERIERAHVTCPVCRCRYSPSRHLRTFTPDSLASLLPGFTARSVAEFGHRAYWYPRALRVGLERLGVLDRPGLPQCPQCGAGLRHTAAPPAPGEDSARSGDPRPAEAAGVRRRGYDLARRLAPRARHPYYLAAVLERRAPTGGRA